jgi:hypothetical protein
VEARKEREKKDRERERKRERERERERGEREKPVVHDRDTLISRGCPEGRREASSNS